MNDVSVAIDSTGTANGAADDFCSAFSERIGRDLSASERSFFEQMFAERGIAAQNWAWKDAFQNLVVTSEDIVGDAGDFLSRWDAAFGAGYRELFSPADAMSDIVAIEDLSDDQAIGIRVYRTPADPKSRFRFKLYHRHQPVPLADVLAILEPMGLKALVEEGFPVHPKSKDEIWTHEFLVDDPRGADLILSEVSREFEAAFLAVWAGETENDAFNRLVLEVGANWREAAAVRALARYRQQTGKDASQRTQARVLVEHADLTRLLLELFRARFDPATGESVPDRLASTADVARLIEERLQQVPSVENDRVLRRIYELMLAITRTNFYQRLENGRPKPAIAFKIASREIADLPEPKPFREIFVSSPLVEGVHLRFGPVARGGLRWSDRRDDFRTEVLGLVKAQQVKNAVIVPVGAKGGFVVKGTRPGDPLTAREAGIEAYRQFLSAMLDVTDNIDESGAIKPPADVVAFDDPDPYLVVAADKGTASFSDIANALAVERGFWLGDAFASGGSDGYDHKAMGITARGAWEAVKRHFRESGKDIDHEAFTVVGVGDMSGDVFGNGMLLSEHTRLIAAFDHRDIFIDPAPDPETSWSERKRLFEMPRSSWGHYDRSLLSTGGTVISRSEKRVELSPEARAALGISDDESVSTPADLIKAILRAPVELLYMGGIGTYVKASTETNADAADKANDAVRVDGRDLRASIVGEGANLGFTQAGRLEFARRGGRINTDAIDNSAGVDSSDLEVNIKILTTELERGGELNRAERNELLAAMTEDVARQVLSHNRSQTLALSLAEADSRQEIGAYAELIDRLERTGRINRALETLPTAAELQQRKSEGPGLLRPELAVVLAHAKLQFFDELVATSAPDDPHLHRFAIDYFPRHLRGYETAVTEHRLRREIIATSVANRLIDIAGPTFPMRLRAAGGHEADNVVRAFVAAGELFGLAALWDEIGQVGDHLSAELQNRLYAKVARAWRRQTYALLARASAAGEVAAIIALYKPLVSNALAAGRKVLSPDRSIDFNDRVRTLLNDGVAVPLASRIVLLEKLGDLVSLVDIARDQDRSIAEVCLLYDEIGLRFGFKELLAAADEAPRADRFDWIALRRVMEELREGQERLTRTAFSATSGGSSQEIIEGWIRANSISTEKAQATLAEARSAPGAWTLGRIIVGARALSALG